MKKLMTTAFCLVLLGSTAAFADSGEKIILDAEKTPIVSEKKETVPIVQVKKEETDKSGQKEKKKRKFSLKSYRTENPFQIQLLMTGDRTVVDDYAAGIGIKASYTLNKKVSISLMTLASRKSEPFDDNRKYTYDEEEVFGQDNVDDIESDIGLNHVLEVNYTPWDFGVYFSAGLFYQGKESHKVDYKKSKREINGTEYTTGLRAEVEYSSRIVPTIGVGYNHVFSNGITIGTGINAGLASDQTPDVDVEAINSDSTVAQADLDHWKDQIEHNEKRYAGMVHFSVGYAF